MKKIKELQKRSSLGEGRNFGVVFSILNKINNNEYETYLPFTACRDYLNDFSFVEYTKKEIGGIHGYNHILLNCFKRKRVFYLGVNCLHYNGGGIWNEFEECDKLIKSNYKNLQLFLNNIENKIGISNSSIELDEETLIIKAPIYWTKNTALISIYTLLIRCFFNITELELQLDIIEMMKKHKAFISSDTMMSNTCIKFIKQLDIDKTIFNDINYSKYNVISEKASVVHNFGIVGFLNNFK